MSALDKVSVQDGELARALEDSLEGMLERELAPVDVCVIDSGIDTSHPDLAPRVQASWRVDLIEGKPRLEDVPPGVNNDSFGHGTATSSIICALAPNAKIHDVRVLGEGNQGGGAALVRGLKLAVRKKWRVVNMSLAATSKFANELTVLCDQAYTQNQIVVASKRNMPLADNGFPSEFASCISVDNISFEKPYALKYLPDSIIEYGAHGNEVTVAASGGGYTVKSGTSFSAPRVSAICAIILGCYPNLRPFELKTVLKHYAAACTAG